MKNEFWQFVSDEEVVKMYERYGLIIVTNWGESKKDFLKLIARFENAVANIMNNVEASTKERWILVSFLNRCYEIKALLGI